MFIDTLYSIAIGLGFTQLPANPVKEKPIVLVFLFTLAVAGQDWYYHHKFEQETPTYFTFQVLSVLVLSQMFRHSKTESLRPWLWYFVVFNLLAICWNLVAGIANPIVFGVFNILLAAVCFSALAAYDSMARWFEEKIDVRYVVLVSFLAVLALGYWVVPIFNR